MEAINYEQYFKGKKVTVLGLGLLGRGLGDTLFLLENGADVICTDTRSEEKLHDSLAEIRSHTFPNLTLVIGENRYADFENRDFVLTCAGMPLGYDYIEHAKRSGVPVMMSASLLSRIVMNHCPGSIIIGVTGTRGKTTATELIAHILRETHSRVHVGGNIRGVANLPLLDEMEDGDFLVLELDSWQLQGFGEMKLSPHIAVFTSFLDDHMNYYKNDKELYFKDKSYIYTNQEEGDVLIASKEVRELVLAERKAAKKKIDVLVPDEMQFEMSIIGEHNQALAALAYEVGIQCGLDDESIREAIKTFRAAPGRLEDMGTFTNSVRVYNDNNGTTGDAVVAGLKAIVDTYNKKPILIVGGADKGLSLEKMEEAIKDTAKEVVYLAGTGTSRITLPRSHEYADLRDCVKKAFEIAAPEDVILFSPGFASFSPFFNNEYERNDTFVEEVERYRQALDARG
jgi:UDP-N-acetylmuramoylalanine--D-glutamate ligase